MKLQTGSVVLLVSITSVAIDGRGLQSQAMADRCGAKVVADIVIERATVTAASIVPAGSFTPPGARAPMADLPAFCRVQGSTTPTAGSLINFEVWIPETWNSKIVATGNGGYSNVPSYRDMAFALGQGYAAVGGDTGHQTPTPDDLVWGVGHPARIEDWGSRSIHAIIGPAKRIVTAVRNTKPTRAYYYGCSTGGHQGYAEMQRYPQDFDGVIAGAPGNNRIRLNAGFLWQFLANHRPGDNVTPIIPASKLPLITQAVVSACDANDGVTDGVVDDPRSCRFDPSSLRCTGDEAASCLTDAQVVALTKMYAGAKDARTGEPIYPGWPKSSEALTASATGQPLSGWHAYWGNTEPTRAAFWRLWVFDNPNWDWWTFEFRRDVEVADRKVGALIDQINPDLTAFKAGGGKAIVYQGWQDPVVNAIDTIAYYEQVRSRQGSQQDIDRFFRLFLVPGMGHCSGGTGTTNFGNQGSPAPVVDAQHDLLSALDAWVEKGLAPDRIIASRVVDKRVVRTRPLCSYPKKAVFAGQGSQDAASSFICK
jgi:feruloyl esterase